MERKFLALALLANGCEESEAVIVIDLLRRAGVEVIVAGETDTITCSRGLKIVPDFLFEQVDLNRKYDIVYLPGGSQGTVNLSKNPLVKEILLKQNRSKGMIAAICAAPLVLLENEILEGNRKITSHPSVEQRFVNQNYLTEKVVVDSNIVTSRGVGTAIDFALKLIEITVGKEVSQKIAKDIVYD